MRSFLQRSLRLSKFSGNLKEMNFVTFQIYDPEVDDDDTGQG